MEHIQMLLVKKIVGTPQAMCVFVLVVEKITVSGTILGQTFLNILIPKQSNPEHCKAYA
jgi:hypothetical protein